MAVDVNAPLTAELVSYLAWEERPEFVAALQASLVEAVCSRFERVIDALKAIDARRCELLIERLSRLPETAFMQVLTAPETGYRMGYDGAARVEETGRLPRICRARRGAPARHGPGRAEARLVRALRPLRSDPDAVAPASGDRETAWTFDARRPYTAPSIDGIVVDFRSPSATAKLPHVSGEASPIAASDAERSVERIRAAIDLIARASTGAQ